MSKYENQSARKIRWNRHNYGKVLLRCNVSLRLTQHHQRMKENVTNTVHNVATARFINIIWCLRESGR